MRYKLADHEWAAISRCCPTNRVKFMAAFKSRRFDLTSSESPFARARCRRRDFEHLM